MLRKSRQPSRQAMTAAAYGFLLSQGRRRRARRAMSNSMQRYFKCLIRTAAIASVLLTVLPHAMHAATGTEPSADEQTDSAPCIAALTANDDDKIIASCGVVIGSEKAPKADRIKTLIARAAAYDRKDQIDRAIEDYGMALRLDPTLAAIFTARGELRGK